MLVPYYNDNHTLVGTFIHSVTLVTLAALIGLYWLHTNTHV